MCFRPSPVDLKNSNLEHGTCPTCGMPVAANPGVESGTCPYCGDPIPPDAASEFPTVPDNIRIL